MMKNKIRNRSLIVNSAIILSVLLVLIIGVISFIMYNSIQNEVYRNFSQVGEKLRDVAQANERLVENVRNAVHAGDEPASEDAEILARLLDGTIDESLVANAYYFSPDYEENGDKNSFTYLMTNEALRDINLTSGSVYEDDGTFSETFKQAVAGESQLTEVFQDEYGYWLTFLSPIEDASGNVISIYGIDFNYNSVKERLDALVKQTIIISVILILISIFIIVIVLRKALKPLLVLSAQAKEAASGDLTVNVPIRMNNEVGQAAASFNRMISSLRNLVMNINKTAEQVTTSATHLTKSANEVKQGSEQIAETMQELATGTEAEADHASELTHSMSIFTTKIEETNNLGKNIQHASNNVLGMTVEGYKLMEQSTQQMGVINDIVRDAVEQVQGLDNQSHKIALLVSVIQDIADQTNLLALNASIEAARAGEQGKGFAVVANEVRNLAEGVSKSVLDITDIVTRIQKETGNVVTSLRNGYKEVEVGTHQVIETGKTFTQISQKLEDTVNEINMVTKNLSEITIESQGMNRSVEEIAAISEESASGIEQTTASAEESSRLMEEITAKTDDLTRLAEELDELVQQFNV